MTIIYHARRARFIQEGTNFVDMAYTADDFACVQDQPEDPTRCCSQP